MLEPIKLEGDDAAVKIGDDVYTVGDISNLKAGHDKNIERKEAMAAQEQELADTKAKLAKLENKDYNFKKLRDMSAEEKEKLTATELELKKKAEELEEKQSKFQSTIEESHKSEAIAVLVGNDPELKKKVLYNYDRISGEANTKEEINEKMREAYNMLGLNKPKQGNPINTAVNFQGGGIGDSQTGDQPAKVDSELAKNLGITEDDMKNYKLRT